MMAAHIVIHRLLDLAKLLMVTLTRKLFSVRNARTHPYPCSIVAEIMGKRGYHF